MPALLRTDACCPVLGADALIILRALFESFDPSTSPGLRTGSASWTALHLASVPSNMAGLGVNGFVYFSRKKSRSAAGTNPGLSRTFKKIPVRGMLLKSYIFTLRTTREFLRITKDDYSGEATSPPPLLTKEGDPRMLSPALFSISMSE